jgi:hypothetical protein
MPTYSTDYEFDPIGETFKYKESMVFVTNDNSEWLVVFDGERAYLYKMERTESGGDKIARHYASFLASGNEYFEFLNDRSGTMVNFARRLLSSIPSTR